MRDGYRIRMLCAVRAFLRGCKIRDAALLAGIHPRTVERLLVSAEDAGFTVVRDGPLVRLNPGKRGC